MKVSKINKKQLLGLSLLALTLVGLTWSLTLLTPPSSGAGWHDFTIEGNIPGQRYISNWMYSVPRLSMAGTVGWAYAFIVKQYDGVNWLTRGLVYDEGFSIAVQPDQPTNLTIMVFIYDSYASSAAQALAYTRVYVTIEGTTITNVLMTAKSALYWGEGYMVYHSYYWNTGPSSGIDYPIVLDYQAYS